LVQPTQEFLLLNKSACQQPLKLRRGGKEKQYEYSHKSIFEYGLAKRILLLQHSSHIVEEGIGLLGSRKIQEELETLQFLQEDWQDPGSEVLIEPLFDLVIRSSENKTLGQTSAQCRHAVSSEGDAL
jgi:hypothetical protein